MADPRFVHLRVHSDFSMVDGLQKIGPIVSAAAANNMPALALTDQMNMCGLVRFYGSAHGKGIQPIVWADFWVASDAPGDETVSSTVGWMQQWSSAGQFVGPPLVGWLAASVGGWPWTWTLSAVNSLLGLWLARRIARLTR